MTTFAGLRRGAAALRIVRRDVRKQPRDGLLVASLVALPVAIIMAVGLVSASGVASPAERVEAELGGAEAWVEVVAPAGAQVEQSLAEPWFYSAEGDGAPQDRDPATALPAGARLVPFADGRGLVAVDNAATRLPVVIGEAWDPVLEGRYVVVSGRTPQNTMEAMVSPALAEAMGLAPGDTVAVGEDGAEYTVVGVLTQPREWDEGTVFVGDADSEALDYVGSTRWIVADVPLELGKVEALNADGMVAFSRDVVLAGLGMSTPQDSSGSESSALEGMVATAGLGVLEVALLAGAAFAVGMRRRQQTMAMLAATGADRGMLVRIGLARGAVLGAMGAAIGVPVGILGGWAWLETLARWGGAQGIDAYWGFHLKPGHVLFAAGFGVVAGVIASLVPSLAASRLDVMAALRGASRARKPRPWVAIAGAGLIAAGAALLVLAGGLTANAMNLPSEESWGARTNAGLLAVAAVGLLFGGALTLVPTALRGIAAAISSWGVSPRMAARDAARNVGRTVPVVAAIAVTVLMGATVLIIAVTDARNLARIDEFWAPPGDAVVSLESWGDDGVVYTDPSAVAGVVADAVPGARTHVIERWPALGYFEGPGRSVTAQVPEANRCPAYAGVAHELTARELALDPRCSFEAETAGAAVAVGGPDLLRYALGREPSARAIAALEAGGAVALDPLLIDADGLTLKIFEFGEEVDAVEVAAVAETPEFTLTDLRAVVSPHVAEELGIDMIPLYLMIDAGDPITPAQRLALEAAVARATSGTVIFAGEPRSDLAPLAIASLVVVLLVAGAATGLALGLARAEARRDDFTLASLGAAPVLVKRIAAWQAALLVFVSAAIGVGCALAMNWTTSQADVRFGFDPPWLLVAAIVVVVPAVVAAIAWVFTRQPRAVHYRLAA